MEKTILEFELIRHSGDDYLVDPVGVFINGWFNWRIVEEFLFPKDKETNHLAEIEEKIQSGESWRIKLEIWEDSDDYTSWIDYKVLESEKN